MRKRLSYSFARLLVFLIALRILDVSVDIDHVTSRSNWLHSESVDDIDSFSEFLLEAIMGDDDFCIEGKNDDQHPHHKQANKFTSFVAFAVQKENIDLAPNLNSSERPKAAIRNTCFQLEDHSSVFCPPPESANPFV